MTSTDLHLQFKFETGKEFRYDLIKKNNNFWNHRGTGWNSEVGYTKDYALWLEEKLLEMIANHIVEL